MVKKCKHAESYGFFQSDRVCDGQRGAPIQRKKGRKAAGDEDRAEGQGKSRPNGVHLNPFGCVASLLAPSAGQKPPPRRAKTAATGSKVTPLLGPLRDPHALAAILRSIHPSIPHFFPSLTLQILKSGIPCPLPSLSGLVFYGSKLIFLTFLLHSSFL